MALNDLLIKKLNRTVNEAIALDGNLSIAEAKGTYPTLKAKLDSITGMVENNATMSVTASRLASLTSAVDGVGQLKTIEGMTVKNLVKNGGFDNNVDGWGGYNSTLAIVNGCVEMTDNTAYDNHFMEQYLSAIPITGHKYYFCAKVLDRGQLRIYNRKINDEYQEIVSPELQSSGKASVFITIESVNAIPIFVIKLYGQGTSYTGTGQKYKFDDVSVIDLTEIGLADKSKEWCDENLVFVNGMVSVLPTGVKTVGKNLFNGVISKGYWNGTAIQTHSQRLISDAMLVEPNKTYSLSGITLGALNGWSYYVQCFDVRNKYLGGTAWYASNNWLNNVYPTCTKIMLTFYKVVNGVDVNIEPIDFPTSTFQLEEGTSPTTYEPYRESAITIPTLTDGLHRLPNGVKDTIDVVSGKVKRPIEKSVFNGGENWINATSPFTNLNNTMVFYSPMNGIAKGNDGEACVVSDKITSSYINSMLDTDIESIGMGTLSLYIRIAKSKLATQDVEGFKAWLSANPTTVLYELATPTESSIVIDNALQSFPNGSIIVDGNMPCPVTYSYPSNIASAVKAIGDVVDDLSNTVAKKKQEDWITPTLLSGWVDYGNGNDTIGYMKDNLGFVHLKGRIKSGTSGTIIFILPTGYRPQASKVISTVSNDVMGVLIVDSSGNLTVYGSGVYCSLENISFRI